MFFSVANHVWARQSSQPHREEQQSWRAIVGNKALGLTALPTAWTPPFLVVGTSLYAEWLRSGPAGRATVLAPTAKALASYMAQHPEWAERGLIIRSSAVRESMKDRGAYQSLELSADFDDHVIVRKITEIFGAFYSSGVNDEIALIVQSRAHTTLKGHLSNERRVAATSNHWMWEIEPPNDAEGRVNSQRESIPDADKPLLCKPGDRDALVELFRRIGRFCTEMNRGRVHLEWGYADQTLWLFQLDFEDEQKDDGVDPDAFLRTNEVFPKAILPPGSPIHVADFTRPTGWSKIDKVKSFLNGRKLPYPSLYFITGVELTRSLEAGRNLEIDIRTVVGDRAVCRTDCIATGVDRLNLPRTDSVSSQAALAFMKDTLAALQRQNARPDQVCFIFHRFIPATVAAWALAIPNQQIVLVDSLWGLPDGLQYLPHDTFEFDIRRNEISAEHIRFKPKFLQETESGEGL